MMATARRATAQKDMTTTKMGTGDDDDGNGATARQDTTTMATGDNDDGDGATGDEVFNGRTNE